MGKKGQKIGFDVNMQKIVKHVVYEECKIIANSRQICQKVDRRLSEWVILPDRQKLGGGGH